MWNKKKSPTRVEKRFEFDSYSQTSKFLEKIDKLCKCREIFPNISFGGKFASLTIFLNNEKISPNEKALLSEIDNEYN